MSHRIDGLLDDLDAAMRQLRTAMKGVPAEQQGFKRAHDRLAQKVAVFSLRLEDASRLELAEETPL